MIQVEISGPVPFRTPLRLWPEAAAAAFRATKVASGTVSLTFVGEARMRTLNREHRGKDRPTDVLSFDPGPMPMLRGPERPLGEIVICPPYVAHEASRRSIPPQEEALRVFIHGCLHLQGFDHATEADEDRMFGLQERILMRLLDV
jgi:probable rRNA maturation factor